MNYKLLALLLLLSLGFLACEKDDEKPTNDLPDVEIPNDTIFAGGLPTEIGQVLGEVVKANIGSQGGSLVSSDGGLSIHVPAGALNTTLEISIQPISNHCPGGVGLAYRILPHGYHFLKPVKIEFTQIDGHTSESLEYMSIAFQDSTGAWMASTSRELDESGSMSIETNHFSDWSTFEAFELYSYNLSPGGSARVPYGEKLDILLLSHIDYLGIDGWKQKGYVPLSEVPFIGGTIEKWSLSGPGSLSATRTKATYQAPASALTQKKATVSVRIKVKGQILILVKEIFIGEGLIFRINKGPWKIFDTHFAIKGDGITSLIASGSGGSEEHAQLYWNLIHRAWGDQFPFFRYAVDASGTEFYASHIYSTPGKPIVCGGGLETRTYEATNRQKYIEGGFIIKNAGKHKIAPNSSTIYVGTALIEGDFLILKP